MSRKRAAGRDLEIPACRNPRRRRRCLRDPALFLPTYFPAVFYNPFSENQLRIIRAFVERIRHGGWKAEADARGEGKTSIARGLAQWAILPGLRRFVVIIAANSGDSGKNLGSIAADCERNDLLADDFPEVCVPIRALGGATQRAQAQTVNRERTFIRWTGDRLVFPTIEGSPASGAIIASVGIDGAIRGMNHQGLRPDLVLIDDPETRRTADSQAETDRAEATIDADITGLAGQGRRIAILYMCTLWNSTCLAARYTDPKTKPAWAGSRHPLLVRRPDREDLWERYVEIRQMSVLQGDETGRTAHQFYLDHQADMDGGAIVSNHYRHDASPQPDGSLLQASTLQFCYDVIADVGPEHFGTEYQNEPPASQSPETVAVDVPLILGRTNGRDRGTVAPEADLLTAGIDVGGRAIHWAVLDWKEGRAAVVDYGAVAVRSPIIGGIEDPENRAATQDAILRALCEFRDLASPGWPDAATGELRLLDLALIDTGYARSSMDLPVWEFCRSSPGQIWRPSKGFGSGSGQSRYSPPARRGKGRRLYTHVHATYQAGPKAWLYNVDADHWKLFVHNALAAGADRPGSLTVFGRDPIAHREYARHLTAEAWTHEYAAGRGDRWYWRPLRHANHWFDATALACAAAAVLGLKTLGLPRPAEALAKAGDAGVAPRNPPHKPRRPQGPRASGRRFAQMERFRTQGD